MVNGINTSKELIKHRMLKHALNFWNLKHTEDLDPAIKLMMEAVSLELCHLGNEIKDTQSRMLEKVSNLMAPDSLTSPNPAHALMHAMPVEAMELVDKTTSFYTQQKVAMIRSENPETPLDIHFTPVDSVELLKVQIKNMVAGGTLYSVEAGTKRNLIARSYSRIRENNCIWLALKTDPSIVSLNNMRFCFDWKNLELKLANKLFQLLPLSKWFYQDQLIETTMGILYSSSEMGVQNTTNIFSDYDLLKLKDNDIKRYYHGKFVTITDSRELKFEENAIKYPTDFETIFDIGVLQKITEKQIWIKVVFPPAIGENYLDELFVYTNAFPVVNRKLTDLKYRLKGGSSIIPLRTNQLDQFLSVESLSDEIRKYYSVPFRKKEEEESGTYTIRNGGAERFDSRNAREQISYLMELLRSETAAFSAYGYDFIATTLKELNQKITLMEQKTKGFLNGSAEIPNYIIVKPLDGQELMFVKFWSTLAELANNIRSGTRMIQSKGTKIQPDSLQLISTSIGGKNRLKPEETLNAFRYGLLTRNRILTAEDIRNFCFQELGAKIKQVRITGGYELMPGPKESFRKTIDIHLTPGDEIQFTLDDWELITEQIQSKLQGRSGFVNYYRVLVDN